MPKWILLGCASLQVLMAGNAFAQDTESAGAADAMENPAALDAGINDIIVTATRTQTLASKTPAAITAIGGDNLVAAGVTNPTNLGEQVPNLSIDRANGLQITIRGVTSSDGTEKGDPSAAFMVNGIYLARPQTHDVSFFDIQRVEVLRGPQGTLFGRNTTAGLINVITNAPVHHFEGSLEGIYGNYNTGIVTGVINMPVTADIAVRAAVNYDRRDSYVKAGPAVTADLSPFRDNLSGRLSALYESGPARLLVVGDYSRIKGATVGGVQTSNLYSNFNTTGVTPIYDPVPGGTDAAFVQRAPITGPLGRDNTVWGALADFSYDLGPLTVNYLGAYRKFIRHEDLVTAAGSAQAAYPARADAEYRQQSHELRLSGTFGSVDAQAGVYFFRETGYQNYYLMGLLSPTPGTTGYIFGFPQNYVLSKSLAGFGQATLHVTDKLRLTGGFRYSHDDKARRGATVQCGSVACDQPGDRRSTNDAERSFSKTTWRAGVDYDLTSTTLLYGIISTGYKAGGFNDGCEVGTGPDCTLSASALYYDPETITSYEGGVKSRIAGDALSINMSVFHYDFSGIQLSQLSEICGGPCQVTTNAGQAKVDGVELESIVRPATNTRFNFAASWLNARYTEFMPTPTADWAGRKLDRSPTWTVVAGVEQIFPLANGGEFSASVRTRLSDSYYLAALGTLNQFRQPSYTKTDAFLTYNAPHKAWFIQGYIRNIENNAIVSGASSGTFASVTLADPRTYGVRTGIKF